MFSIVAIIILASIFFPAVTSIIANAATPALAQEQGHPIINDPDFVAQRYVTGICCSPTAMAFVTNNTSSNSNDILVLQKTSGEVHLIRDGRLQQFPPVLRETVTSIGEQGMLTIATKGNNNNDKVYIYFTEAASTGGQPLGKRVYSYNWDGGQLVNKTLVKDMPQTQTYHNGGAMTFDKNGTLYIAVGDAGRYGVLQNNPTNADGGKAPDDTSVIQQLVPPGPYRAIGVRNSFGLATDPVTGAIWDTENGDTVYDEINIVPPNFNSGWNAIMGPAHNYNKTQLDRLTTTVQGQDYAYHDPQFSWEKPISPTGLAFVPPNSEAFAAKYGSSLFVGGFNTGILYRFQLNENRDGFVFNSPQLKQDDVADIGDSQDEITFGTGFGAITDVVFGPDGFLYIVSLSDGTIYRIVPASSAAASENQADASNNPLEGNYYPIIATMLGGEGGILGYYFGRKFKRRRS